MLDADLRRVATTVASICADPGRTVVIDAADLVTVQPVGICLLSSAIRAVARSGRRTVIRNAAPAVRYTLEDMHAEIDWEPLSDAATEDALTPNTVIRVESRSDANDAANVLATAIARFIPAEDRTGVLRDKYGLQIFDAVQPALAYVASELLDNVFSHSRSETRRDSVGWIAAQYYSSGDLVRVSIVDDGCGFLESMRALEIVHPKRQDVAIRSAFQPFVSSKCYSGLYSDSSHMGLGLTVCRDLCQTANGTIYCASGTALVSNPGTDRESVSRLDHGYQGAIIALEFHRRAVTPWTIGEIVKRYSQPRQSLVQFSNS